MIKKILTASRRRQNSPASKAVGFYKVGVKSLTSKLVSLSLVMIFVISTSTGCVVVNFGGMSIIQGEGEIINYSYNVSRYNQVRFDGDFEVEYKNGDSDIVTIDMQENLYEHVEVSVNQNQLLISSKNSLRIDGDKYPKVIITTPELNSIEVLGMVIFEKSDTLKSSDLVIKLSGVGEINADIEVQDLTVELSGTGNLTLRGMADNVNIRLSGAGSFDAFELESKTADISISGTGGGSLNCLEKLKVSISGLGSLTYRGDPVVDSNISGLGSVNKVG